MLLVSNALGHETIRLLIPRTENLELAAVTLVVWATQTFGVDNRGCGFEGWIYLHQVDDIAL